jgi:hypothetical protein
MADKKITQLTDLGTAIASADLFNVVQDPTGTPINKKVSTANVFNNIPTFIGLKQTADTLASTGSASITTAVTLVNATASTPTISLVDGSEGQIKTIIDVSTAATNNITITPTNLRGYTSVILNAPGETVTLMFKSSKWNIISGHGYTAV